MKVTVCIPIYKVEQYIEKCAVSLFEQTMQDDIEFVFVNDCTPDKSIEVLEEVIKRYPARQSQVKIIHHPQNKGLTGARNTALKHACGDYIIHCDSDDYVDNDFCEKLYQTAVENNADVAVAAIQLENRAGGILRRLELDREGIEMWFEKSFHSAVFNSLCNKLFARHIALDPAIAVPDHITMAEDLLRTTQMLFKCQKGVVCPSVVYHYFYGNEGSSTMNYSVKTFASEAEVLEILKDIFPEQYAAQRNVCYGLLVLSGLCANISTPEIRKYVPRSEHFSALFNRHISSVKRAMLFTAYCSMPLARTICRILLWLVSRGRTR